MNPDRVPALPQSEITSPVQGEYTSGTTTQADPFISPSHPNVPLTPVRIDSGNSNLGPFPGNAPSATSSDALVKLEVNEESTPHHPRNNLNDDLAQPIHSSVRFPESIFGRRESRVNNNNRFSNMMTQKHSGDDTSFDWREYGEKHTVGDRLQFTLRTAILEKERYAAKAKWTGIALNAAIGLQVLLGSLTTGLSAYAVAGQASSAKATTALGAMATLVASYLARARGSNEPELSITRCKDLDQFIRKCKAFQMDHGHIAGNEKDKELIEFRREFEELLGNGNG